MQLPRPPPSHRLSLQRIQELMPGNWRVLSVSVKRGSPACSKVTSHSGVTLCLFVLAGKFHEDVLMPVRLKCLHNTICSGFLPANVQTNWEPPFRAQMLPIMKLIKNLNYNDRLSTGIFSFEVNRKAVERCLLLWLTKLFLHQPQAGRGGTPLPNIPYE